MRRKQGQICLSFARPFAASFHINPVWVPRVININFLLIIPIHYQKKRLWDLIKWSAPPRKCFDHLSNSLNYFFKEMYRDQLEPTCMWILGLRVNNHQLRRLRIRMFSVWEANLTLHKKTTIKLSQHKTDRRNCCIYTFIFVPNETWPALVMTLPPSNHCICISITLETFSTHKFGFFFGILIRW